MIKLISLDYYFKFNDIIIITLKLIKLNENDY